MVYKVGDEFMRKVNTTYGTVNYFIITKLLDDERFMFDSINKDGSIYSGISTLSFIDYAWIKIEEDT